MVKPREGKSQDGMVPVVTISIKPLGRAHYSGSWVTSLVTVSKYKSPPSGQLRRAEEDCNMNRPRKEKSDEGVIDDSDCRQVDS